MGKDEGLAEPARVVCIVSNQCQTCPLNSARLQAQATRDELNKLKVGALREKLKAQMTPATAEVLTLNIKRATLAHNP